MKNSFQKLTRFFSLILLFFFFLVTLDAQDNLGIDSINTKQKLMVTPDYEDVSVWMDKELSKAKRNTLLSKDMFFTNDTARVIGYIKGYHTNLGFNKLSINATNELINEPRPIISEIDSSGRFACTIPMKHPKKITLSLGNQFMSLYLEPGQVLALSFEWNDFEHTDGFKNTKDPASILLFEGPLAKMNYDLMSSPFKTLGYRHYGLLNTHTPEQYLAAIDSILDENEALANKAFQEGKISKNVIDIQKNEASTMNGFYLLDYAITKCEQGVKIPSHFYTRLQRLPLNDPTAILSSYAGFINRFEVNPIMNKAYQIVYGKPDNPKVQEHIQSMKKSEVKLKIWNTKDSLINSDFNIPSGFAYEVTKIRSISNDIKEMDKNEAYAYYYKLKEGIKHPYLQQEGLRIVRNYFGEERNNSDAVEMTTSISGSIPTKWIPVPLPDRKDAMIFKRLIEPYKGKYLFIDFWGTSCGPCRWGIEEKKEVREQYKNNNTFEFVFITSKMWSPDRTAYEKYVKDQNLEHSLYLSDDDFNYMTQLFHFTGVPHYVMIDPEGNVIDNDFEMFTGFENARKWMSEQ